METLKVIAGVLIMIISAVGVFYFRGVKAGVPWICKLIGHPEYIKSDYHGPMYELGEDGKFHFRDDDDDDDEEDEEEETLSKF